MTQPDRIERAAKFDCTGRYRYWLSRRWRKQGTEVAFIMLNPSQADATRDDPTLRACIQFAQCWQHAALNVVNLFGYRTHQPKQLSSVADPIGPENDQHVMQAAERADQIVLAWGNWGRLMERDRTVLQLLTPHTHKLHYLQLNCSGQPRHPLYIKRSTPLQRFETGSPVHTNSEPPNR